MSSGETTQQEQSFHLPPHPEVGRHAVPLTEEEIHAIRSRQDVVSFLEGDTLTIERIIIEDQSILHGETSARVRATSVYDHGVLVRTKLDRSVNEQPGVLPVIEQEYTYDERGVLTSIDMYAVGSLSSERTLVTRRSLVRGAPSDTYFPSINRDPNGPGEPTEMTRLQQQLFANIPEPARNMSDASQIIEEARRIAATDTTGFIRFTQTDHGTMEITILKPQWSTSERLGCEWLVHHTFVFDQNTDGQWHVVEHRYTPSLWGDTQEPEPFASERAIYTLTPVDGEMLLTRHIIELDGKEAIDSRFTYKQLQVSSGEFVRVFDVEQTYPQTGQERNPSFLEKVLLSTIPPQVNALARNNLGVSGGDLANDIVVAPILTERNKTVMVRSIPLRTGQTLVVTLSLVEKDGKALISTEPGYYFREENGQILLNNPDPAHPRVTVELR